MANDIIQDTFLEDVGVDFVGTPRTGNNRIVASFTPIINDADIIQDILTGTDIYQDVMEG